jgi:hypothetical protein
MGRHTAPRSSVRATLDATARLGSGLAHRATGTLARRSLTGAGAAVAAVALTASTATATLFAGPPTTPHATTASSSTTGTTAGAAFGLPVVTADPAVVDAASDELVRAEFVTRESSGSIPGDQAAKIEQARTALKDALVQAGTPALDVATSASASGASDAETAEPAEAQAGDAGGAESAEAEADDETARALASRDGGRASRDAVRTPLDELAAPLEGAPTLSPPLVKLPEDDAKAAQAAPVADPAADATPAQEEPGAEPGADESPAATEPTTEPAAEPAAEPGAEPAADEEISALTEELRTLLDASEAEIAVEAAPAPPAPEPAPATPAPEVVPAPPSPEEIAAQLDAWASSTAGFGNGQIPADVLCEVSFAPGEQLRCDADHQFEALNAKYREAFGTDISVTDSYRSYDSQVATKASRGYFAAVPGTSNHGWGLALDLGGGIQDYGTAQYEWMRANAPAFGFDNPEWARAGGAKNEPWHWEYGDLS